MIETRLSDSMVIEKYSQIMWMELWIDNGQENTRSGHLCGTDDRMETGWLAWLASVSNHAAKRGCVCLSVCLSVARESPLSAAWWIRKRSWKWNWEGGVERDWKGSCAAGLCLSVSAAVVTCKWSSVSLWVNWPTTLHASRIHCSTKNN